MAKNNKQLYEDVIKDIKVGDIVSFKRKSNGLNLKGEVREAYIDGINFYIKIYSFFERKEILFILNKNLELILSNNTAKETPKNSIIYYDLSKNNSRVNIFNNFFVRIIALILIISFVLTINPHIKIPSSASKLSYEEFLLQEYSLNTLFRIVSSELDYSYDLKDEWMTPKSAWEEKRGDCEEYAVIISDYLTSRKISNYIVGINYKNSQKGHAVVFANIDNVFYMIDPTFAVEKAGIRKIKKAKNLRKAVKEYSSIPAGVYKIPSYNGEKKVLDVIY